MPYKGRPELAISPIDSRQCALLIDEIATSNKVNLRECFDLEMPNGSCDFLRTRTHEILKGLLHILSRFCEFVNNRTLDQTV